MKNILKTGLTVLLIAALLFSLSASATVYTGSSAVPEGDHEPLSYTIDYYELPELTVAYAEPRYAEAAKMVVDAFFQHETRIVFDGFSLFDVDMAGALVERMCPLVLALTDYNAYQNFDEDTCTLTLTYYYDEAETQRKIAVFEEAVDHYMRYLAQGDSEVMKALILYYAYTRDATYDYEEFEDPNQFTIPQQHYREGIYRAIVEHQGICSNLANGLGYLYKLAGIRAEVVSDNSNENNTVPHAWLLARLDGEYYFMDPTYGVMDTEWFGSVFYFGMNAEDRYQQGGYLPQNTKMWYQPIIGSMKVESDRFKALHEECMMFVYEFVPDHEAQTIRIVVGEDTVIFDAATPAP